MITGKVEAELEGHMGPVNSVVFSQDGSRVVSGSDDKTVRIWNVSQVASGSDDKIVPFCKTVRSEMQLLSTPITLPDTSIIHGKGKGDFHISYPEQRTLSIHGPLSISDDCQWIEGALYDCCILPHNQNFTSSSISDDRVCLGYGSGNLIIFDMNVAS